MKVPYWSSMVAASVFALALAVPAGAGSFEDAGEEMDDAYQKTEEGMEEGWEETKEGADDAWEETKEETDDAADAMEEAHQDLDEEF